MRITKIWLDYLYECFFLFVVMEIVYIIINELAPVGPLVTIVLLFGVVFTLLRKKSEIQLINVFFLILVGGGLGNMLGLNIYASVLWAILVGWRSFMHFIDSDIDTDNQHALFLYSLGACLFVYLTLSNSDEKGILLLLPFIQFFFLILLKMLNIIIAQQASAEVNRKYTMWSIGALGITVMGSIMAYYFFPAFKSIVITAVMWIGTVLGYVIATPITWLINVLFGTKSLKELGLEKLLGPPVDEEEKQPEQVEQVMSPIFEWIIWILVIGIFIGVVAYLYKKKFVLTNKILKPQTAEATPVSYSTSKPKERVRAPKDKVRKRFYQLQKSLARKGYARYVHESVQEWLERIDDKAAGKSVIAEEYRKVRYGEKELTEEEVQQYEKRIKELIKQTNKKQKEN
ncbi:DUF4129 domain-containing protein [Virgibacillus kekensis]|uniref:DUF4129 domain-containing protein n=1 Tax=Virgibacillus kekensis TaxID=202261 RepID=A0ABV9DHH9_9BACI